MATSTNLLGTKIHEVQDSWGGKKDLQATTRAAMSFPKDIHFFMVVAPTESPKIMGPKGIHSPKALQWWSGLTFCPWCGKEGQDEGNIVHHLQTMHYHLGLICAHCLEYITTSSDAMHQHAQLCKPTAVSDNDNKREDSQPDFEDDDNGNEDDEFIFEED